MNMQIDDIDFPNVSDDRAKPKLQKAAERFCAEVTDKIRERIVGLVRPNDFRASDIYIDWDEHVIFATVMVELRLHFLARDDRLEIVGIETANRCRVPGDVA